MTSSSADIGPRKPVIEAGGKEELRLLIIETLELPMLPPLMNAMLRVSGRNGAREAEIVELISSHRSLAGNILDVANSDSFGLSQQAPDIHRAIRILGYEAVRSLALGELVIESAAKRRARGLFDRKRFRLHSLACAYISKKIAAATHRAEMEPAFICGLLHDIGKAFLAMYFPDSYNHVITLMETGALSSVQGEDRVLGFTHAEVGMWLAQRWKLPKSVVFAIANHHGAAKRDKRYGPSTSILRLANHICRLEKISLEDRNFVEPLEKTVLDDLRLGTDELAEFRRVLAREMENLKALA